VGFVATIVAILIGFWFYPFMAAKLGPWIPDKTLANFCGFILLFGGVMLGGALVGAILSRFFAWIGLSWLNRLLGGAAGFCRGVLIVAVLVDVFVAFAPSPTPEMLQHSLVVPYVSTVAGRLVDLAPNSLKAAFDEEMENLKRYWERTPPRDTQTVQKFDEPAASK
jgi:membrane protein required for colicin V production